MIMLDLLGSIAGMSTIAICLLAFIPAVTSSVPRRLLIAALAGAWVGLASGLGAAGMLALGPTPGSPVPLIAVLLAVPLATAGLLTIASPGIRAAFMSMPLPVLIGVNSLRVLGVLFLLLAAAGRLAGPFPYLAGLGDILTGAVAIPLALGIARTGRVPAGAVRTWNFFGILDLVVAVTLGVTSSPGSPLQLIHAGVGSAAVQQLPFCLIPTVLVPFFLITHGIVAAQLGARRPVVALSHA
jgi:hypothetical protein